jgi:hypothetical protein
VRSRLTYANVMATVAVFIALGGGAYAISLGKNSVGSKQLKPGAVKPKDTANSLRLKCPGGTRYHEGACIEVASRPPAEWFPALEACNAANRRLPSATELAGFAREPGITIGLITTASVTPEWTAGIDRSGTDDVEITSVLEAPEGIGIGLSELTDDNRFRCVANALG